MNIVRLLKLKEISGDFDHVGEDGRFLIELLKNTHSKKSGVDKNVLLYNKKGYLIFSYNTNNGRYWISNVVFNRYYQKFNYGQINTINTVCEMFNFLGITVTTHSINCTLPDQQPYKHI